MFKSKRLALGMVSIFMVLGPAGAQSAAGNASTATDTAASSTDSTQPAQVLIPKVCPANPGLAQSTDKKQIKSEPRLIPAPWINRGIPGNTDTVTTPSPSSSKKVMKTPVPGVTQASVPEIAKQPLTLDRALEIAFKNSPDIRVALDQVERSRGVVSETRSAFNPTFNLQGTTVFQGPTASVPAGDGTSIPTVISPVSSAALNVLLPLDISHRIGYASEISQFQFQIQYLSMVSASEKLILNVKGAYYDLLRACGQLSVAQAAVEDSKVRLDNTKARHDAGTAPLFDVTTAEVDLANLNQQLIAAQNRVYIAQAALNRVLGVDINNPTQVENSEISVTASTVDIPGAVDEAYTRRPEVKAAQMAFTLAKTNVNLQKTGLLPSLGISGGPKYNFNPSGYTTDRFSWQACLQLTIPLSDGGVTRAKVREAKADVQNSSDTLDQVKLNVAQEIRTASLNLQEAALRTQTTAKAVALAEEALGLANVRYEAGIALLVEVTNAQSQLTQARFNHINAQFDYAVAQAQLLRATSTQPELNQLQLLAGNNVAKP